MEILITGKLSAWNSEMISKLIGNHRLVCAADGVKRDQFGKEVSCFSLSPSKPDFEKVLQSHSFEEVIFFSGTLYEREDGFNEFDELNHCLQRCARNKIQKVLFFFPKINFKDRKNERVMAYEDCLDLCEFYRVQKGMSVVAAALPNVYGVEEYESVIGQILYHASKKRVFVFPGKEEQQCGILAASDFSELLKRICENWPKHARFNIPPAQVYTFGKIAKVVQTLNPKMRQTYAVSGIEESNYMGNAVTAGEYTWRPTVSLENQLEQMKQTRRNIVSRHRQGVIRKIGTLLKKYPIILRTFELILGYMLMEFLLKITGTMEQFHFIDFRLLYVVAMGVLHGIHTGLIAAFLASTSLLTDMVAEHSAWNAVAHDIDTWLPFLFLFLIGTITGYVKDRAVTDKILLNTEKNMLEKKYQLLNNFYTSALENKDLYKNQIVSYQDSYGRIFGIAKNLDSTFIDEVYAEAIPALEDILDNHSACIYEIDTCATCGRLVDYSREIRDVVPKNITLADYSQMMKELLSDEVWVNRERLKDHPEYAYPVYFGDNLVALVFIWKATYEQMAVYYENLVKIICGLLKIAMVRALDFEQYTKKERYLEGTRVLNADYFDRLVDLKVKMIQMGIAKYTLVKLNITDSNKNEAIAKIASQIYSTDALGVNSSGRLYMLLSQTDAETAHRVLTRIQNSGVSFEFTVVGG